MSTLPTIGSTRVMRERVRGALSQRLFPITALHRKTLADAIGVNRDTLDNWFNGVGEPRAEYLGALIKFFWERGDHAFLWEVLSIDPPRVVPVEAARAAQTAITQLVSLLEAA